MKKNMILVLLCGVVMLCGCQKIRQARMQHEIQTIVQQEMAIWDTTIVKSDDERMAEYLDLQQTVFLRHPNDSLGLRAIINFMLANDNDDESLKLMAKGGTLIQENETIVRIKNTLANKENCLPGRMYMEICGIDAITEDSVCLSQYIRGDKPVIIDFWASWCHPCQEEIRNHLLDVYAQGKVDIVGVAVWEDSVSDTQRAMEQLGVKWPVIYTGGRANSPTAKYGVLGIPTLFLLGADGTIQASAHSVEDLE